MSQSSSPTASTLVKAAALAMAVPALLLPMKAAAQQMAANTPDYSRCDRMAQANPLGATRCRVEVLDASAAAADARGAAADVRLARAENDIACGKYLLAKKADGVKLDPARFNREKACAYAKELGMQ